MLDARSGLRVAEYRGCPPLGFASGVTTVGSFCRVSLAPWLTVFLPRLPPAPPRISHSRPGCYYREKKDAQRGDFNELRATSLQNIIAFCAFGSGTSAGFYYRPASVSEFSALPRHPPSLRSSTRERSLLPAVAARYHSVVEWI